jgi:hypothetical protein
MDGNPYDSPRAPPGESCTLADSDQAELRLLARLHYALGLLTALASLLAMPFIWAGRAALDQLSSGDLDQEAAALVLLMSGASLAALCLVHAGVLVYVGLLIRSCRRWWLVIIFSVLHTMNVPLGTALSIYTFMVLGRQRVKARFFAVR